MNKITELELDIYSKLTSDIVKNYYKFTEKDIREKYPQYFV